MTPLRWAARASWVFFLYVVPLLFAQGVGPADAQAQTSQADITLILKDSSGSALHAVGHIPAATAPTTGGAVNRTMLFNGTAGYAVQAPIATGGLATSFTYTFWFKGNDVSATRYIFADRNWPAQYCFVDTSARLNCRMKDTTVADRTYQSPTNSATAGVWHFGAFTHDAATKNTSLYLDGSWVAGDILYDALTTSPNTVFNIGSTWSGANAWLGSVDEWRRYDVALTDPQLDTVANGTLTGTDHRTNLRQWYRFDEAWDHGAPLASYVSSAVGLTYTVNATPSLSLAGYALTYAWDFGDGNTATDIAAVHEYAAAGDYLVTLTVTEATTGYTDTSLMTVTIENDVLTISTSLDPYAGYAPVIVWSVLLLWCLARRQYLPAFAAFLAVLKTQLPEEARPWGMPGDVYIFLMLTLGQVLYNWNAARKNSEPTR